MQSGISASQELVSEFNKLLADDSLFGLIATIRSESLQPVTTLPSTSSDFAQNLSQLEPHLQPTEALYILLKRHADAPRMIAVSYVPDSAKVRQKMLFASTRLTLVRELGSEHFRETIFATTAEELGAQGFAKHDRHAELEAPLTEEERTLGEVKRAEAEAGAGTGQREIHLSKNMNMPVATDALVALSEMGREQGRGIVMLKINPQSEVVELVPEPGNPSSVADLVSTISSTEPRFTFWRYTHSHQGVESNPILFFYTCPAAAGKSIKFRMMYPLMKRAVLAVAEGEAGLQIEKKFEVEEPDEITEETIMSDLHPKVEVKQAFRRPKRPGR
ncbi:actin depolymerizing protein [Apiospora saccharicola]|uniref:Actin depolymerizing protein n=1 Tax=Apiospora saccharicola TaxID=335842 RepID=A0ABR1VLX9_9PEZI